ncbi:hypothetical protein OXPF_39720 [Oxobacter pfennigii]|uniref:Uncharacterized protein n=1 Tax=Oxobacter pfennigii TaxID=36849 RepID=A0A0P8WJ89_9CLOT|nr:hypothetical protein [Oxobacter pfennigii]KPU42193.1 hypothetical protein OXPF_39720 [Oxobacter pfennigii]
MAIKVIFEYPDNPDAMAEIEDTQARITLDILKRMLTPIQLEALMNKLRSERKA